MGISDITGKFFYSLSNIFGSWAGVRRQSLNSYNYQYMVDAPAWLSLSNNSEYRQAVQDNPVLYGCVDILATAEGNGKKYLVDSKGKEVDWSSNRAAVKAVRKMFIDRPNPLQSPREFNYERAYMYYVFGNNYVFLNNPLNTFDVDILNVQAMYNLPSEFMEIKQTGKLYDQVDIRGIISEYCLTNSSPVKRFDPARVILFNEINISDVGNSIIGTSRLGPLKYAITNTQLAFEAMNVILRSRGMQGIIKSNNKDATGTQIPMGKDAKEEIDRTFNNDYGLRDNQKKYLISYSDIDFIKTIMSPREMGIYDEFSNNAMIISNGLKVPPELYKTYIQGATFENQLQAVRRLYQDTTIPKVENDDQYWTERLGLRNYDLELRTDFSHIPALAENYKDKAAALSMNVTAADKAYNNNIITRNHYLGLLDLDVEPPETGDLHKFEFDQTKLISTPATTQNQTV